MKETKNQRKLGLSFNYWIFISFVVVIFIGLVVGVIISGKTNLVLGKKLADIKEAERPANLDIIVLQESSCQDCPDMQILIGAIKQENVKVNSEKTIEITSSEGMELINKYNIIKAPTFIVSGEIEKEANLKAMWPQLGEIKDDVFILTQVGAPYILTSSGDVIGRVELVMLTDNSCSECYNVVQHQAILKQLGLNPTSQTFDVDSPEGKELVNKYNIELLPTIILTGDVKIYPSLIKVWPQVGTIEDDGTYIFREGVMKMGIYKDLFTGEIVRPVNTNQQSQSQQQQNQVKKVTVSGTEFSFTPADITVNKGENIQLTFVNNGSVSHDFVIDELGVKTRVLSPGQSQTVQFVATNSQTLSFYCSVGNHRQAGMEGKIGIQ